MKLGFKLCTLGSCSDMCNSYVYVKDRYGVKDLTDYSIIMNSKKISTSDELVISNVKDLLCMRE